MCEGLGINYSPHKGGAPMGDDRGKGRELALIGVTPVLEKSFP